MTDEEFNDYMSKKQKASDLKNFGDTSMHQSRESAENDRKLESYWRDMPSADEYLGPF